MYPWNNTNVPLIVLKGSINHIFQPKSHFSAYFLYKSHSHVFFYFQSQWPNPIFPVTKVDKSQYSFILPAGYPLFFLLEGHYLNKWVNKYYSCPICSLVVIVCNVSFPFCFCCLADSEKFSSNRSMASRLAVFQSLQVSKFRIQVQIYLKGIIYYNAIKHAVRMRAEHRASTSGLTISKRKGKEKCLLVKKKKKK